MRVALFAFLLLAGSAQAQPLLVAVAPDLPGAGPGDEGFAIASREGPVSLAGFSVTDGEGVFDLPPVTVDAERWAWFTGNLSSWTAHDGPPAIGWSGTASDRFQLANDGDTLRLVDAAGGVVDAFAWGDGTSAGFEGAVAFTSPGLVYTRARSGDGLADCDCEEAWITPRMHRIGESDLARPVFHPSRVTLYASPDSSFGVLRALIANATTRLHLHVYELRSAELVDSLVAAKAAHPSLDLQVLVDGAPVGMDLEERHAAADALRRIEEAGGTAWLGGTGRFDHHHLKVLVADQAVAVQSENWVPSGVPSNPSWGNRGWGAVVHDEAAADWFAGWMAGDRSAWDTAPFELADFDPTFRAPPRLAARTGEYGPTVPAVTLTGTFTVTPVVSPDHTADPATDPVGLAAGRAVERFWVEQLDLRVRASNRLGWAADDPLAAALLRADQAGADVRVLAAAPFSADDDGNAQALEWISSHTQARARVFDRPGIATLHNKGFVADDTVVLGSMNANHASRSQNREVDLVLQGPGVAEYYGQLFLSDDDAPPQPRDWGVVGDDLHGLGAAPWPTLLAVLGVALALRRRP